MPEKDRVSRAKLMAELEKKLDLSAASELNKDMHRLSLQAAAFLLGDPEKKPEADMIDGAQAAKLAEQIMRKSGPQYMKWNYGNLRAPETKKHFEGMLLLTMDGLALPDGIDCAGKKALLHARIEERGPTYAEYLLMNTVRTPGNAENREKGAPEKDGAISEKTGKIFAALTHCMSGNAGMPALRGAEFDREAQVYCGMPLCRLTLRNRQMAEMLEHREFNNVSVALKNTQDSFQFAGKEDFRTAQKHMKTLLTRMSARKLDDVRGKKWHNLKQAARSFVNARFHVNDVDAVISARLFLAVESFVADQKNAGDDPNVALALSALAVGVPDAPRNPGVKRLADGLNAGRGPGEARITIPDLGAPSVASRPAAQHKPVQRDAAAQVMCLAPELTG